MEIRLNKFLADNGVASRRRCDELIADGKVTVDGLVVTEMGLRVRPEEQRVEYDGVVFKSRTAYHRYYLLNKPGGVVCTNEERENRPRAIDLIRDPKKGRIFTVGRLDEKTTGLIILTNDGDFANRVMHPRFTVPKTYAVKLEGRISDGMLNKLRDGIHLSEGRTTGARIIVKRRTDRRTDLIVTITEGKNREIRRIFAKVGYEVKQLHRQRIAEITDRGLKIGSWRFMAPDEVNSLLNPHDGPAPRRKKRPLTRRSRSA